MKCWLACIWEDYRLWFVVSAIIGLFALGLYYSIKADESKMQRAYLVWVKQTGNERNISYQEWRDLIEATRSVTPITQ